MSDFDWFMLVLFAPILTGFGAAVIHFLDLPFKLMYAVVLFLAVLSAPGVFGFASRPAKSEREVRQAREARKSAEKKARKAREAKKKAEQEMEKAKEKAEEETRRRKELEKSVKERQRNMTQEINEKAERGAYELAEEKAEKMLKEKAEKKREELIEKDKVRRQALTSKIREEADEEIEEERQKFRKLSEIVIEDEELLSILWDGPITEERFKVLFRASEDSRLRKELESIQAVNGNVDMWIERKAEELEEEEETREESIVEMLEEEPEPEREKALEEEVEEVIPEDADWKIQAEEENDSKAFDVLEGLANGYSSASEIGEYIGVSARTVKRRYPGLEKYDLIVTSPGGTTITDRGEEFLEWVREGSSPNSEAGVK